MKTWAIVIAGMFLIVDHCGGDAVDASSIRQFVKKVEDSLVKGNIYHINYEVCEKRTDAFYAHKKELIKLFEQGAASELNETPPAQRDAAFAQKQAMYPQVIRQWKKDLTLARELTIFCDYSLDGTGFYTKHYMTYVKVDGTKGSWPPSITVSDGKIMGNFYLSQSQAVIQPATERPQGSTPVWTDTAYLFMQTPLSTYMGNYLDLSMKEEGGDFVITGEKKLGPKELGHSELRINGTTLTPESLVFLYYNKLGVLHQKLTKTWQYRNFAGLLLPKCVTEQEYNAVLNESPELEKERILTINQFDPVPLDAKAEFAKLLKSDLSVFDEITGTHYLSGNPGNALDKLSK